MNQCAFDGTRYVPCDPIMETISDVNGHTKGLSLLALANMKTDEEYYGGLIYRYGRKKDEVKLCNYCPACGTKITLSKTKDTK